MDSIEWKDTNKEYILNKINNKINKIYEQLIEIHNDIQSIK